MAFAFDDHTKVKLVTSDNYVNAVNMSVAKQMETVKRMIDNRIGTPRQGKSIPLLDVTNKVISLVIKYCEKHVELEKSALAEWDSEFVRAIDTPVMLDLVRAADYLGHQGLLDLTRRAVADLINNKSHTRVRGISNIGMKF